MRRVFIYSVQIGSGRARMQITRSTVVRHRAPYIFYFDDKRPRCIVVQGTCRGAIPDTAAVIPDIAATPTPPPPLPRSAFSRTERRRSRGRKRRTRREIARTDGSRRRYRGRVGPDTGDTGNANGDRAGPDLRRGPVGLCRRRAESAISKHGRRPPRCTYYLCPKL